VSDAGCSVLSLPRRLWSLEGMLRVYADRYLARGERINDAKAALLYMEDEFPTQSNKQMVRSELEKISADPVEIERLCRELELPTASKLIKKHM
jgi:hypothetical protein